MKMNADLWLMQGGLGEEKLKDTVNVTEWPKTVVTRYRKTEWFLSSLKSCTRLWKKKSLYTLCCLQSSGHLRWISGYTTISWWYINIRPMQRILKQ